jgi:hypothetical protein
MFYDTKPLSRVRDQSLESGALGESALKERSIIWDLWGYGNSAMRSQNIINKQ